MAAGHGVVGGLGGNLFGGAAKQTVGVNPYKDILGVALRWRLAHWSQAFGDRAPVSPPRERPITSSGW
ncbi:hypothetical protein [Streptomyces chattanoogensis]|uniref:hypothetical protein n=1 Tax=Streptomyces chattanoogensis TaxID=66876 RepID=UPI0036BAA83D